MAGADAAGCTGPGHAASAAPRWEQCQTCTHWHRVPAVHLATLCNNAGCMPVVKAAPKGMDFCVGLGTGVWEGGYGCNSELERPC